jgi:DNA-binding transcriptional regulator of glucitol operon
VRRFFTPGWLGLHALALTLVTVFLLLGWWQLGRASGGNMRSWAYALEWPLFAIFAVAMWVKMIHDELTGKTADAAADGGSAAAGSYGRTGARMDNDEDDPELAAYNRYLARLDAEARPSGGA